MTDPVDDAARLAENESLESQVNRLATFIMENIPGEPSQNQGAIDTAIRLLAAARAVPATSPSGPPHVAVAQLLAMCRAGTFYEEHDESMAVLARAEDEMHREQMDGPHQRGSNEPSEPSEGREGSS